MGGHGEWWCWGAWPLLHPVSQVRFQGYSRAMRQGEGTVAQQHNGPSAWCVQRVQKTLRFGGALALRQEPLEYPK